MDYFKTMSFMDRKAFQVTEETHAAFKKIRKRFNCKLCGRVFAVGDTARWIYANFKDSPVRCGNFFVCGKCDAEDSTVLDRAKLSYDQAASLAKQWDIYGPEWQDDVKQFFR